MYFLIKKKKICQIIFIDPLSHAQKYELGEWIMEWLAFQSDWLGLLMVTMETAALNCVLHISCHVEATSQSSKAHATSPTASAGEIAEGDN